MNEKFRAVIIDDEPLARDALRVMLSGDDKTELVAECRDGREAVSVIREQSPDIVFLDVQMPEMNGFEVVKEIGVEAMPTTIFVTAFDKYAVRAFEARALDYLLKPFDHERFGDALTRAKTGIRRRRFGEMGENLLAMLKDMSVSPPDTILESGGKINEISPKEPLERFVIKSGGRIYFLKTEEVDSITATGDYVELRAGGKAHLMRETISRLHARLDSKKFLRIHRSIIVNIERIKDISPLFKGEYVITLTSGKQLKSSRGYRSELRKLLDEAR